MSKNNCGMIKDLLPLYADSVCSEESRKAVAEHIADCDECRGELEKMGRDIAVAGENDISTIKRIKKRILIEKIVIIAAVLLVVVIPGIIMLNLWFSMDCTMDYERYNLAENVRVEEDADGNLWLCKKNSAVEAWFIYPDLIDTAGNRLTGENFDRENACAMSFTLKQRRLNAVADSLPLLFEMDISSAEERTMIFNKADKEHIGTLYYYDDVSGTDYVLWERK